MFRCCGKPSRLAKKRDVSSTEQPRGRNQLSGQREVDPHRPDHEYHNSIADAVADLDRAEEIGRVFAGFQKYLYQEQAAA